MNDWVGGDPLGSGVGGGRGLLIIGVGGVNGGSWTSWGRALVGPWFWARERLFGEDDRPFYLYSLVLFFGVSTAVVRHCSFFPERTMGEETIRGGALEVLDAKRAYNGVDGGGWGGVAAAKGIGADGTGFTGTCLLFFLRRKPAIAVG